MNLSLAARLLFIGLITQADDEGRGSADSRYIKASIFPDDRHINITKCLVSVASQSLIELYAAEDGSPLYAITNWRRHQRVDKPKKSNFPSPKSRDSSPIDPRSFADDSTRIGSDQGSERIKDQGSGIRSARARVLEDPARSQNGKWNSRAGSPRDLPSECRLLAAAGNSVGDIVKLLAWTGITAQQVDGWLAAVPA